MKVERGRIPLPTLGLAKVGLEEYELNNLSLVNNKLWAEAEVTPILNLCRPVRCVPYSRNLVTLNIMAYNDKIAHRIRTALSHLPEVKEKKMFGGLAFMVDNKMCITTGLDRIMCRINPAIHEEVIKRKGCRTVIMGGREYKGYVDVNEDSIKNEKDFNYWIGLALDYNKIAKASISKR